MKGTAALDDKTDDDKEDGKSSQFLGGFNGDTIPGPLMGLPLANMVRQVKTMASSNTQPNISRV
jgi:hypothetical protein